MRSFQVFELHFIRVAQQVADVDGFVFGHQAPLHASGEACTAAALEAGVLHGLDDIVLSHVGKRFARSRVTVLGLVLLEPYRLGIVTQAPGQRVSLGRPLDAVGRAEGSQGHG
jgi:hypothetical protein